MVVVAAVLLAKEPSPEQTNLAGVAYFALAVAAYVVLAWLAGRRERRRMPAPPQRSTSRWPHPVH